MRDVGFCRADYVRGGQLSATEMHWSHPISQSVAWECLGMRRDISASGVGDGAGEGCRLAASAWKTALHSAMRPLPEGRVGKM